MAIRYNSPIITENTNISPLPSHVWNAENDSKSSFTCKMLIGRVLWLLSNYDDSKVLKKNYCY